MAEKKIIIADHLDEHDNESVVETIFRKFSKMEITIAELKRDNEAIKHALEELHQLFTQLNLGSVITSDKLIDFQERHDMKCKQEILCDYVKKGKDFAAEYDALMRERSNTKEDAVTRKGFKDIYEETIKDKIDNTGKIIDFVLKLSQVLTPIMIGIFFLMKAKIGG